MKSPVLVLSALLLSVAADATSQLKPIRGEVIINRILLATPVLSDGLDLQDTTHS